MTNRDWCNKNGYTMTELSKLSGVPRTTLYDIDANKYKVNPKTVRQVLATRKALERLNRPSYILPIILWLILLIVLVLI